MWSEGYVLAAGDPILPELRVRCETAIFFIESGSVEVTDGFGNRIVVGAGEILQDCGPDAHETDPRFIFSAIAREGCVVWKLDERTAQYYRERHVLVLRMGHSPFREFRSELLT